MPERSGYAVKIFVYITLIFPLTSCGLIEFKSAGFSHPMNYEYVQPQKNISMTVKYSFKGHNPWRRIHPNIERGHEADLYKSLEKIFRKNRAFKEIDKQFTKGRTDYTLDFSFVDDEGKGIKNPVLAGLSFGIVAQRVDYKWDIVVKVMREDKTLKEYRYSNKFHVKYRFMCGGIACFEPQDSRGVWEAKLKEIKEVAYCLLVDMKKDKLL